MVVRRAHTNVRSHENTVGQTHCTVGVFDGKLDRVNNGLRSWIFDGGCFDLETIALQSAIAQEDLVTAAYANQYHWGDIEGRSARV